MYCQHLSQEIPSLQTRHLHPRSKPFSAVQHTIPLSFFSLPFPSASRTAHPSLKMLTYTLSNLRIPSRAWVPGSLPPRATPPHRRRRGRAAEAHGMDANPTRRCVMRMHRCTSPYLACLGDGASIRALDDAPASTHRGIFACPR